MDNPLRWIALAELTTDTGRVNLGVLLAMTTITGFGGIHVNISSGTLILTPPPIKYLYFLGIILIISIFLVMSHHFGEIYLEKI